ncbi:MAG: hypothetical protein KQI78_17435, partial [Deltaproteobacteria bacterium]|nr:hypothetical protein [Deltaproteobacteria bacterium]
TPAFHAGDRGSNPLGDATAYRQALYVNGCLFLYSPDAVAGHWNIQPLGVPSRGFFIAQLAPLQAHRPRDPIASSGTRVLTFHKAWDKTMIPLPFSKMVIDFGEPFRIAADADDADMETMRLRAEESLKDMTDNLDRICGYALPMPQGQ